MKDKESSNIVRLPFYRHFIFILFLAAFSLSAVDAQMTGEGPSQSVPGVAGSVISGVADTVSDDDLCSINAIRRFLAQNITYPVTATEEGQAGTVELYARISNNGRINEILELQPVLDYIELDEIVIVAYAPEGIRICQSARHTALIEESRRVVMSMPRCDIQEIFGQTLKFTFRFVLQQP